MLNGALDLRNNLKDIAIFVLPVLLWWMWLRLKSYRANAWPLTQGRFESGNVSVFRRSGDRFGSQGTETATATLAYSYQVSGEYYGGNYNRDFNDEQKAWDYVDATKSQSVQVRYHPRRPEKSMVRPEDQILGSF